MKISKKANMLQLMRERQDFVSGQELCESFGISRTAVWKMINQLKEDGYQIEAVTNKGYRLIGEAADIYHKSEIESRIITKQIGKEVYFHERTGSTNVDAKQLAEEGADHGTLVVANRQDTGRGRRGRLWQSPADENIFFSVLLRPEFSPEKASCLTIVMALAVARAIEEMTPLRASIKWPNDIVINKKKVCGILTEMSAEMDYIQYVVIGTGINVNMSIIPEEVTQSATSLYLESGHTVGRSLLLAKVLECFEEYYHIYCQTLNLQQLKAEYQAHLVSLNAEVRVLDPQAAFNGISRGITDQGELLVEKENGEIVTVYAGEVSVRGVYGYV